MRYASLSCVSSISRTHGQRVYTRPAGSARRSGGGRRRRCTCTSAMQGTLVKYGDGSSQLAFISGAHPRHLLLIGGLTDGLMFAPYCQPLAAALDAAGWSLVQVQLSSSYTGYGIASLDQDADELLQLVKHVRHHHHSSSLVLMGHSTGCQDIVRFMQRHASQVTQQGLPLLATVLQAPVSDREWLGMYPELADVAARAVAMVQEGRGREVVSRLDVADGAPMSAQRFVGLYCKGGDDDMFSADLGDDELQAILSPAGCLPCLLMVSGSDEAVPPSVNIGQQAARLATAIGPSCKLVVVEGAGHALKGHEQEAAHHVVKFVELLKPQ